MSEKNKDEIIEFEEEIIDTTDEDKDDSLVIRFKKPYVFEGTTYEQVDLSNLENMSGNDMIKVERYMKTSSGGADLVPEMSVEYALLMAARATELPIEFFKGLPLKEVRRVKTKITGFIFG